MNITDVRINLMNSKKNSSLLAFANITIDDELILTGIKVVEGKKGNFVAMPSREGSDGEYYDIFFPLSKDVREEISDAVLEAYDEEAEDSKKSKVKKSKGKKSKVKKDEDEEDDDIQF